MELQGKRGQRWRKRQNSQENLAKWKENTKKRRKTHGKPKKRKKIQKKTRKIPKLTSRPLSSQVVGMQVGASKDGLGSVDDRWIKILEHSCKMRMGNQVRCGKTTAEYQKNVLRGFVVLPGRLQHTVFTTTKQTAETSLRMADPWQNWNQEPEVPQPGCPHHPQEEVWHRSGYCDLCVWAMEVLETWPNGESRDIPLKLTWPQKVSGS